MERVHVCLMWFKSSMIWKLSQNSFGLLKIISTFLLEDNKPPPRKSSWHMLKLRKIDEFLIQFGSCVIDKVWKHLIFSIKMWCRCPMGVLWGRIEGGHVTYSLKLVICFSIYFFIYLIVFRSIKLTFSFSSYLSRKLLRKKGETIKLWKWFHL